MAGLKQPESDTKSGGKSLMPVTGRPVMCLITGLSSRATTRGENIVSALNETLQLGLNL